MNFKNSLGWRRQILEGYVVTRKGRISIITKDTSTDFLQCSALYPVLKAKIPERTEAVITMMAGSYCGTSNTKRSGLFSTGIFFMRQDFRNLNRYDVRQWKIGLIGGYGLVDPKCIPSDVMKYMVDHDFHN